uniref:Putative secreted protein n=1 Tax=Lutzomyia longipalpis TaxID=7200 RepID=A0A7G3AH87_LUTLO
MIFFFTSKGFLWAFFFIKAQNVYFRVNLRILFFFFINNRKKMQKNSIERGRDLDFTFKGKFVTVACNLQRCSMK